GVRKDGEWKLLQIQSDAAGKLSLVLVDIANAGVSGTTSLFRVTEGAVEELITGEITLFGWSWNEVYYVDHIHPNPGQSIEQVIRFELSAASESFTKTDKVLERIGAPWVATKENSLRNPIVALKMFKLKKEGYVMHYWAKDSEIWRPL
ncbi:MAG: hypothetical protein NTV34_00310, partial [Proteobacteria bacterium]|nr:hypothetical protein [Pseudomonadota bacterium]